MEEIKEFLVALATLLTIIKTSLEIRELIQKRNRKNKKKKR
ncbi:hypothetical protein PTHTG4_27160 [Parageobacillus thermoglucosidasius]|nr:hypothetical protein PTHTG4_27160 [Parageobacillus thermoglucosidasius]